MIPTESSLVLLPIERELQERLAWFIRMRWLAGVGILLGTWFASGIWAELYTLPLFVIGLAVLAYNTGFYFYRPRAQDLPVRLRHFIYAQIGLDWLALTLTVHFSGGIRSAVVLAFTFHIIIGAILLSRVACYLLAVSASFLVGLPVLLQDLLFSPPAEVDKLFVEPSGLVLSDLHLWFSLTGFFCVTAYLATSITGRLREKEEALFSSERALTRAYHELEALNSLGQAVNSTLDLDEVLGLIAENSARLMNMKACFIRLFDKTGKKLYIGGSYGLSQAYIDKGPVELEKSLIDSETLKGGAVQILDVGEDSRFQYREEARKEGLQSMLCVPVQAKQRVLGVIRVYSGEPHRFSEQEQSLLKNMANLGAVAIENANSYRELQALNDQKVWFARMTHHQLRTPLAAVQGIIEALPFGGPISAKQGELIQRAKKRIRDAFDLIRDLLDLASAQRVVTARAVPSVDLVQALQGVIETIRENARNKGVEFILDIREKSLRVNADEADLSRIFSNLLDNAVKYTSSGGRVIFLAQKRDGQVVTEIQDTGIGIEPSERDRIFEGFYRTKAAKATGEMGTGLGLSIVQALVERMTGTLELESEVNCGTSFRVILPLAENPNEPAESSMERGRD